MAQVGGAIPGGQALLSRASKMAVAQKPWWSASRTPHRRGRLSRGRWAGGGAMLGGNQASPGARPAGFLAFSRALSPSCRTMKGEVHIQPYEG